MEKEDIVVEEKKWKKRFVKLSKAFNLKKNLFSTKNHLDFGCGLGIFLNIISKKFPSINFDGIDIDNEMIKIAKKRYKRKNLNFKCSKKIIGRYDCASLFFVLHEAKNPVQALKEVFNSLNKNSKVFIYEYNRASKKDFRKLYDEGNYDGSFEEEYLKHNQWTLSGFEKMCKKIGFKTINISRMNKHLFTYIGEKI